MSVVSAMLTTRRHSFATAARTVADGHREAVARKVAQDLYLPLWQILHAPMS